MNRSDAKRLNQSQDTIEDIIGDMRHRVILQKKTVTRDASGAEVVTYSTQATIWAKIEPMSGREYFESQQRKMDVSHRIVIRYRRDVRSDWRFLYGNRIFTIESIINNGEHNTYLELMCKESI